MLHMAIFVTGKPSRTSVFNTVYAGMMILASVGKLRSEARMTAEFLKQVNDTFDLLNVRAFGTKTATPLRANSNEQRARLGHME